MEWVLIVVAIIVLCGGAGGLIYCIILDIALDIKKEKWLQKMKTLEEKNHLEHLLEKSSALLPLVSFAKLMGISFKLHPESFRCSEKKEAFVWSACNTKKEIEVSIDPETLQIVPRDLGKQIHTMAHEIGHIISPTSDFQPSCFDDPKFRLLCRLESGEVSCFFRELGAEIETWAVLRKVFPTDDALKKECIKNAEQFKEQCKVCWERVEKELCPKKEEIILLSQKASPNIEN